MHKHRVNQSVPSWSIFRESERERTSETYLCIFRIIIHLSSIPDSDSQTELSSRTMIAKWSHTT